MTGSTMAAGVPARLAAAIRASWGPDTAFDPAAWSPGCPEAGHCAVTAVLLQDFLGGTLLTSVAPGGTHFWNLLPTGEADLTRGQFPPGWAPAGARACHRDGILAHERTAARYAIFASRARALLARERTVTSSSIRITDLVTSGDPAGDRTREQLRRKEAAVAELAHGPATVASLSGGSAGDDPA